MIINIKKTLQIGGINADVNPKVMPPNDYISLENMRSSVGANNSGLSLDMLYSTVLRYDDYPAEDNICTGSCFDYKTSRLFWVNVEVGGSHSGIYCYDVLVGVYYIVLLSTQTEDGLLFSETKKFWRNMRVANGMLLMTDNLNEPYEINIEAGIKLNQPSYVTDVEPYLSPIPYSAVTLIKRPPAFAVFGGKNYDGTSVNNFVKDNAYQFAFGYQFKNYEYSAFSEWSLLVPFNFESDNSNRVSISFPLTEKIEDDVQRVELYARRGNDAPTTKIKIYDKANPDDAAAIIAHNSGATQLVFQFYDDFNGEAVDIVRANSPFHNVPRLAKTLEVEKNRAIFANNLSGYNTPNECSLAFDSIRYIGASYIFKAGGVYNFRLNFYDRYRRKCGVSKQNVAVTIPDRTFTQTIFAESILLTLSNVRAQFEIPDWAFYYSIDITKEQSRDSFVETYAKNISYASKDQDTGLITVNAATAYTTDTYAIAVDISELFGHSEGYVYNAGDYGVLYTDSGNLKRNVLGQYGSYVLLQPKDIGFLNHVYHSRITSQFIQNDDGGGLGITFDYAENSTAGITCQSQVVGHLDGPTARSSTNWFFSVTDGKRYFCKVTCELQVVPNFVGQFGVKVYLLLTHPTLANIVLLLGEVENAGADAVISIEKVEQVPAGYTKGFIYSDCSTAAGGLSPSYFNESTIDLVFYDNDYKLIELYTPYKHSLIEPYYAYGQPLEILNPATIERLYSSTSIRVFGDCYRITRTVFTDTTYNVESMSPNDSMWQRWERSLGWANYIDDIGQKRSQNTFVWSDTFISGSKVNGLNVFQPLNSKNIGSSTGEIQKLQGVGKQQEVGSVLLIITNEQTLSAYLEAVQLVSATNNIGSPIQSSEFVGTINPLKLRRGTLNPESVIENNGFVWWFDVIHGKFCQYSDNGLNDISAYGLQRFTTRYSKRYLEQGRAAIEALCGFSDVISCIDGGRVLFMMPQVEASDFQPNLPSYLGGKPDYASSIKNRFDLYSNASKPITIAYSDADNRWKEVYEWIPEWAEFYGENMFGFKGGKLYQHDADTTKLNNIYGINYPARMMFVLNEGASSVKELLDIAIEATGAIPSYSVAYIKYPYEQLSDLVTTDFTDKEGQKYASWLRDRLDPNGGNNVDERLQFGQRLRGAVVYVMLEFTDYTTKKEITFIDLGANQSSGHTQIETKNG